MPPLDIDNHHRPKLSLPDVHLMSGRLPVLAFETVAEESACALGPVVATFCGVAIARLPLIIIDRPDPGELARFYGAKLGRKTDDHGDQAPVSAEQGHAIAFHRVSEYTPTDVAKP